jgi:DNA segregation ATPase FtsK/SpoIIIE-like protein
MDRRLCLHALTTVTAGTSLPAAALAEMPHQASVSLPLPTNAQPLPSGQTVAPDPLYEQAVAIVMSNKKASIALVQRHLRLGYSRAVGLFHSMEQAGLISAHYVNGYRQIVAPACA